MQNKYTWTIIPLSLPKVIKSCSKCKSQAEFVSSGNFRVNANQSNLDVWLIYQCSKCKTTWNMEILSRVNSRMINKELYQKFLQNDPDLAEKYAFDAAIHSKNKTVLKYENIRYQITGDYINQDSLKEEVYIEILCEHPLDLRIDKVIGKQLGLSREAVKKLGSSGRIYCEGIKDLSKAKIKNGMIITIKN